jgi:RNA polymerase sigma-70 factor (ECF subfamily)
VDHDAQSDDLPFATVFRRHFDYVWRCAHAVAGAEAADDVTQEAFLVVRRRLPVFAGGSLRAWLFSIVRNVARNHARGQRRREHHLRAVPEPPPHAAPDDALALREAAELLDAFVATLSPPQRDAFVLMEMEGLTAREVADAAGVPTRTVYSRLRAARQAFEAFAATHDPRAGTGVRS